MDTGRRLPTIGFDLAPRCTPQRKSAAQHARKEMGKGVCPCPCKSARIVLASPARAD
jgi:hypothetical protein